MMNSGVLSPVIEFEPRIVIMLDPPGAPVPVIWTPDT
jgi:hypothetical protein